MKGDDAINSVIKWIASPLDDISAFNEQLNKGNIESANKIFNDIIHVSPEKEYELHAVYKEKSDEWMRKAYDCIESAVDAIHGRLFARRS